MDVRSGMASILVATSVAACGGPGPSAPPPPSGSNPVPVNGRERLEWDQQVGDGVELSRYRFAAYVDSQRVELATATCRSSGADTALCSSPLPPMSPGVHVLTFVAYITPDDVESVPSTPLTLAVSTPADAPAAHDSGEIARVESGADVIDCAVAALGDGAAIVALPTGELRFVDTRQARSAVLEWVMPDGVWTLRAVATHPEFVRNRWIYVLLSDRTEEFRLAVVRYRELNGVLGERAVLATFFHEAEIPRPRLRFGPEGSLYVALLGAAPGRDSAGAAGSDGDVFIRRLHDGGARPIAEGKTPEIEITARAPSAFDWDPVTRELWIVDQADGAQSRVRIAQHPEAAVGFSSDQVPVVGLGVMRGPDTPAIARAWVFLSDGVARQMDMRGDNARLAREFVEGERDRIHDALLTSDGDVLSCGSRSSPGSGYFVQSVLWR